MVLHYKFEYVSNNHTLINFLIQITQKSNVEFEITRFNNEINFYAQAEQNVLEEFSQYLSASLPMSIYFKNTSVDVIQEMPRSNIEKCLKKEHTLPFCPKCLQQVEDETSNNYNNPFTSCEVCDNTVSVKEFILQEGNNQEKSSEYQKVLNHVAKKLNDGLKVQIKTLSGTFIFERFENLANQDSQDKVELLCTNLANISKTFVAQKSEVVALASIEKPSVQLRINEIFKHKNIIKTTTAKVRFANDLIMYLLSKELSALGIDFLSYAKDGEYDLSLEFDGEYKHIEIPSIKITQDDRVIMLENSNYNDKLTQVYQKFEDKDKGHFMVLLQENDLFEKSIINFYSSQKDDDNVALYSNEIGSFLDILNYKIPKSMEELFDEIAKEETGQRLIENYKNKYPEVFEEALNYDVSHLNKKSIVSFWEIAQKVLGFDETILNSAMACLLEKGPRIDYKFFEQEKIYNKQFNFSKLIKSGMSFKLAGVEQNTIALGYIESYAHFISNVVDEVNNEVTLDGISLCGDIFANNLISNFVHKSITKNYKIYYNKDFVIQVA